MVDNKKIYFAVLGAGKGTRMNSDIPKVMHPIATTPMLKILLDTLKSCETNDRLIIVAKDDKDFIAKNIGAENFLIQEERLGTAHATSIALQAIESAILDNSGILIVLYGDTPFISKNTILALQKQIISGKAVSVVGFEENNVENQYGRLILNHHKELTEIIEFNDADAVQKNITLCNSGVMALDLQYAKSLLEKINNNNNKNEYYLTDIVAIALSQGLQVGHIIVNQNEVQGINNKTDLAKANKYYFNFLTQKFMDQGVTLLDPDTIYLSHEVTIGKNVVIEPNVTIQGKVTIADNVRIKSFSYIENAEISANVTIGPFARIRPNAHIKNNAHIGNFVEIKNSIIGEGSKVNHLSYIGDCEMESKVNVGAGTITCNYDGYKKHKTIIKENSFIGSNTALIAPVKVGKNTIVAAGSTIIDDISDNSITIARAKQKNIINGAEKYRAKKNSDKT